jgi:hypothetical protein
MIASMKTAFELVASTPHCHVTAAPGVAVVCYWGRTSSAEVEAFRAGIEAAHRDGMPIAVAFWVHRETRPPDRDTRDGVSGVISGLRGRMLAMAGIVEGSGLGATSRRTLMRAVFSMTRLDGPAQVFSDPRAAASWLAESMPVGRDGTFQRDSIAEALAVGMKAAEAAPR